MHSSIHPTWICQFLSHIPLIFTAFYHWWLRNFYPHTSILKELSPWCHSKTSTPITAWNYNIPKYGHVSRGWRLQDKVGIWKQTGNEWQSNRNLRVKEGWVHSYWNLRNYLLSQFNKYLESAGSWSRGETVFHQCK